MTTGEDRFHHQVKLPPWLDFKQITALADAENLTEEQAKDKLFRDGRLEERQRQNCGYSKGNH